MTGNVILLLSEHENILLHTKQVHDEVYLPIYLGYFFFVCVSSNLMSESFKSKMHVFVSFT